MRISFLPILFYADNTVLNLGTGGDTVASDDIGGIKYQRVKATFGADGTATDVSATNPLPISHTDLLVSGNITTQNLVPGGTATAGSAVQTTAMNGFCTAAVQVTGTYTGALSAQGSVDGTNWITMGALPFLNVNTSIFSATIPSAAVGIYQIDIAGFELFRVTALAAVTGTATVTIQVSAGGSLVSLDTPIPAGTNAIGKLAANSGVIIGDVNVVSITPPTLTKGTQGSTGYSTQDLKDAGRTYVTYTATALAAGATTVETMQTLTKVVQPATSTSGTSHTPTSGKRYRIQSIIFSVVGHATATTQSTNFSIRCNPSGATINTSVLIMKVRLQTPATTLAYASYTIQVPDGLELVGDGTLTFGVSTNSTFVTNAPTMDVNIIGYEY